MDRTDHELLIELSTKMNILQEMFTNHLAHHQRYLLTLATILGSGLASIFAVILAFVLRR